MSFVKAVRKQATPRLALTGKSFGNLTVVGDERKVGTENRPGWECKCLCGKLVLVRTRHLESGHTKSCGCIKSGNAFKHGHKRRAGASGTYVSWQSMIQRCAYEAHDSFPLYGGSGVTVCERWKSFDNFLEDMGDRPLGASIDRNENSIGYEPGNCKWSTTIEQANNKKNNIALSLNGQTGTMASWSAKTGLPYSCLYKRVTVLGWSSERALTTPSRKEA